MNVYTKIDGMLAVWHSNTDDYELARQMVADVFKDAKDQEVPRPLLAVIEGGRQRATEPVAA